VIVLPGGEVIDESLDIMRWSLARHDPLGWLERDDPALIAASDGPFKHDLDRAKYPQRHDSDAAVHRLRGLEFLRELEARLSANGQLCGAEPGLADMAIMPFVRQFAAIDGDWFAAQSLARVQAWLAGHVGSDLFAAIMVRVPPWRQGDAPTPFAQF
jgi:glutathione S-transferase